MSKVRGMEGYGTTGGEVKIITHILTFRRITFFFIQATSIVVYINLQRTLEFQDSITGIMNQFQQNIWEL